MTGAESHKPSRRGLLLAGGAGVLAIGAARVLSDPSPHPAAAPAATVPAVETAATTRETAAATSPTPTAVPPPEKLPSRAEFDLSQPAHPRLSGVRLHESGRSMQGIGYDIVNQRLFIVQRRDRRSSADLCVNQLSLDGEPVAHLHIAKAGHGQSLGVEPVGSASYLWLECDTNKNTKEGRGTALGRFRFVPGRRPELKKFFDNGVEVACAIDPVNHQLLIRRPEGGRTTYSLYDLAQAANDFRRPLARFPEPRLLPSGLGVTVLQAFAVLGRYAYTLVGDGGHAGTSADPYNSYLSALDINTGEVTQQQLITAAEHLVYREPEGMAINVTDGRPQLCFGLASRPSMGSDLRYANVFSYDTLRPS